MTYRHRSAHSRHGALAFVLVVILALRLVFGLVDVLLRVLVWALTRACWMLEWAITHLTLAEATRAAPVAPRAQRVPDSGRMLVAPVRDDAHEVERFARVLAGNKRPDALVLEQARQLLATRLTARPRSDRAAST